MGLDIYLKIGVYSKWEIKPSLEITEKNICKMHGEKYGTYCDQCGRKLTVENNIYKLLNDLFKLESDISFNLNGNDLEIMFEKYLENDTKIFNRFKDHEIHAITTENMAEIYNNFFNSDIIVKIKEYFTLKSQIPFFGKHESY